MSTVDPKESWKQRFWFIYRFLARLRMTLSRDTIHLGPSGERYYVNHYSFVERMIKQGEFENKRAAYLHDLLTSEDVFVDIGANIGFFTVIAAQAGATVHAFEPDETNYQRLLRNLKLNGFKEPQVKTYRCALSDKSGHATLYRSLTDNYGRVSLVSEKSPDGYEVPLRRLDDILTSFDQRYVVKVDVEGAEVLVLDGALGMMVKIRPGSLWLVEVHLTAGVQVAMVAERFTRFGYAVSFFDDVTGKTLTEAPPNRDILLLAESPKK